MGCPVLQPKAWRNSGMLTTTPLARMRSGECGSTRTAMRSISGRSVDPHFCAHPRTSPRFPRCLPPRGLALDVQVIPRFETVVLIHHAIGTLLESFGVVGRPPVL